MAAKRVITGAAAGVLVMPATGCNPTSMARRVGANVVGDVVHDTDTKNRAETLIGKPPAEADEMFGERVDTL
jgi:hypothetical protein